MQAVAVLSCSSLPPDHFCSVRETARQTGRVTEVNEDESDVMREERKVLSVFNHAAWPFASVALIRPREFAL